MFFFFCFLSVSEIVYRTYFNNNIYKRYVNTSKINSFRYIKHGDTYYCSEYNSTIDVPTSKAYDYLVEGLNGTCKTIIINKLFRYKFCPFDGIVQYNNKGKNIRDKFNIGRFLDKRYKKEADGITMRYTKGDVCPKTKKLRETVVKFQCDMSYNDEGEIVSVYEEEFCKYYIKFNTKYACAFLDKREEVHDIFCSVKDNVTFCGH